MDKWKPKRNVWSLVPGFISAIGMGIGLLLFLASFMMVNKIAGIYLLILSFFLITNSYNISKKE